MAGIFGKVKKFIGDPRYRMQFEINKGKYNDLPDEAFLKKIFEATFGYQLNLQEPKTFSEKLQWLKLYDHKDIYTTMVDKYAVKDYVSGILGEEYIIPTLGVWEDAADIDFEALPEQFVLKTTHDSHALVICKDKSKLDIPAVREKMAAGLKRNYYIRYREWPYKNVKPRIIAENYMEDESGELQDYKIHNFNGEPKVILVCRDRFSEGGMTEDFFDADWNHLDVRRPDTRQSETPVERPELLPELFRLSEILAGDIPFVRTDFYIVQGKIYFGEITFFPASGLKKFVPESFDRTMGDWLDLS